MRVVVFATLVLFRSVACKGSCPWAQPYAAEATINLQRWQGNLFYNTMSTLADMRIQAGDFHYIPRDHARFQLFNNNTRCPPNLPLENIGDMRSMDGVKWGCGVSKLPKGCIVYSLGSNGDFTFEEAVLTTTQCEVHTFDCTFEGRVLSRRHHYHKICIGTPTSTTDNMVFMDLQTLMSKLQHKRVDYLKVDIEGAEYDLFSPWKPTDNLPLQLQFELHALHLYLGTPSLYSNDLKELRHGGKEKKGLMVAHHGDLHYAELSLFMQHLSVLGYAIVARNDNPLCPHCTELTLLRVENC